MEGVPYELLLLRLEIDGKKKNVERMCRMGKRATGKNCTISPAWVRVFELKN